MDISVDITRFNSYCQSLNDCRSSLYDVEEAVSRIKANMRSKLWMSGSIGTQLNTVITRLHRNGDCAESLRKAITEIGTIYTATEISAGDMAVINKTQNNPTVNGPSAADNGSLSEDGDSDTDNKGWLKGLMSVVGKFGLGGGLADAAFSVWSGDIVDMGKALIGLIGSGAGVVKDVLGGKTVDFFGVTKTIDAIGFRENLAMQFDKFNYNSTYNINNMTESQVTANNIGVIAKWGGAVVTGITRFFDNYEEYDGDFGNYRMYAETIGETAVKVIGGAVVTAGVATVMGASAPVWAVAAVGTGIVIGANYLVESLTGEDIAEHVSDFVINTGETIVNGVVDFGEKVGGKINNIGESIGEGINCIGETVASWFSF